ncbi:MAG: sigma-70 family RNA polymerase sigma factor [Verrucomicrobia bacterium]|nr:sigma-70 family RNA polymerase sigma factor [Verrucomicrobiota bacterium]
MPSTARLAEIYDAHAAALYAHLLNLLRDEAAVQDVLQEVFLRLARDSAPLDRAANRRAYLLRLAHNLAVDTFRRRETRTRREADFAAVALLETPDDAEEAVKLAAGALDGLPEEQRLVVQLKIWDELTFAEIAEVLGISPNTAASRWRYALEKLRAALGGETIS